MQMILTIAYVIGQQYVPPQLLSSVRLHSAPCRLWLDLHLLQVFVGGVFVAVVLHLAEVAFLWCQHGVNLYDAMTDGAVLPLPQKHQTDHNHSCYGHSDHQQANQCTAPKTEVLSQGAIGLQLIIMHNADSLCTVNHFFNIQRLINHLSTQTGEPRLHSPQCVCEIVCV